MTCKDCVHYELCFDYTHLKHSKILPDNREDVCEHFKNKANFVELPCKVGDTVYCVDTILKTTEKCKVYGVGFFKDGRIQLYVDDGECKYVTDNWYNTKEEAEKKLKGGTKSFEILQGEWIYNTDEFSPKMRCSVCGYNKPIVSGENIKQEPDNYCSKCGSKMKGGADNE